jgi:molybdenum cofactor sulfurtransferase
LVYPAQSNFNGRRYKHADLVASIQDNTNNNNWYTLLDTASYASTSNLDLSSNSTSPQPLPDFAVVSFYKMFGFPTGLGALLINKKRINTTTNLLSTHNTYFGGGNVQVALLKNHFTACKTSSYHERFEQGTVPYLDIIAVGIALDKMSELTFNRNFQLIGAYLNGLSQRFEQELRLLSHSNGAALVELYRESKSNEYGPVFAFNLKTSRGKYISFVLVDKLAQAAGFHLRVGCFCNIGACQLSLPHLTDDVLYENYRVFKHKCGDHIDLIDGRPTGAIRVSFGYCSVWTDAERFVAFLKENFVETREQVGSNRSNSIKG